MSSALDAARNLIAQGASRREIHQALSQCPIGRERDAVVRQALQQLFDKKAKGTHTQPPPNRSPLRDSASSRIPPLSLPSKTSSDTSSNHSPGRSPLNSQSGSSPTTPHQTEIPPQAASEPSATLPDLEAQLSLKDREITDLRGTLSNREELLRTHETSLQKLRTEFNDIEFELRGLKIISDSTKLDLDAIKQQNGLLSKKNQNFQENMEALTKGKQKWKEKTLSAQETLKTTQEELELLRTAVTQKDEELNELVGQLTSKREEERRSLGEKVDELREQIEMITRELLQKNEELDQLNKISQFTLADVPEKLRKAEENEKQIEMLNKKAQEAHNELETLAEELQTVTKDRNTLSQQIQRLEKGQKKTEETFQGQLKTLTQERDQLASQIKGLEEQLQNAKTLQEQLETFTQEALKEELETLTQERDLLANQIKTLQGELQNTNELQAQLETLTRERDQLADQIKGLEEQPQDTNPLQEQLVTLTNERDQLANQIKGLEEQLQNAKALQEQLETLTLERDQFSNQIKTLQGELQNANALQEQLETLTRERDQLANQIKGLEEQLQNAKALQEQLETLTLERDQFSNQIKTLQEELQNAEALQTQLETLTQERDLLSVEVKTLDTELNENIEEWDATEKAYQQDLEVMTAQRNLQKSARDGIQLERDQIKEELDESYTAFNTLDVHLKSYQNEITKLMGAQILDNFERGVKRAKKLKEYGVKLGRIQNKFSRSKSQLSSTATTTTTTSSPSLDEDSEKSTQLDTDLAVSRSDSASAVKETQAAFFSKKTYHKHCWGTPPTSLTRLIENKEAQKRGEGLTTEQQRELAILYPQVISWLSQQDKQINIFKKIYNDFITKNGDVLQDANSSINGADIADLFKHLDPNDSPGINPDQVKKGSSGDWLFAQNAPQASSGDSSALSQPLVRRSKSRQALGAEDPKIPLEYVITRLKSKIDQLIQSQEWIVEKWEKLKTLDSELS